MSRSCSVEGCERPYRARGYCVRHYELARKEGRLALVQPRRTDRLCVTCRNNQTMDLRSSYCRKCASEYERARRQKNADALNARNRARYDPKKRRAEMLRYKYGITDEHYKTLLREQDGGCAICTDPSADSVGRPLSVDHCHASGNVRGLLCTQCNNGLGRFHDNPELLRKAANYIERYRCCALNFM
jgi:hypothetical protein